MRALAAATCLIAAGCVTPVAGRPLDTGGTFDPAPYRGRVLVVDVWASWCGPCAQALPYYAALEQELGPRGFSFVGIDVDDDPATAAAFLSAQGLASLRSFHDAGGRRTRDPMGVARLPTALLVDRHGVVRAVHEGFQPSTAPRWRQAIEQLLDEP